MPGQPALSPDERYRDWVERIERIQTETTYLFWIRKLFRAIRKMFQTNQPLGEVGGMLGNGSWASMAGTQ